MYGKSSGSERQITVHVRKKELSAHCPAITLRTVPLVSGGHVALRVGRIQVSLINLHAPFTVFAIPVVCGGSDWNLPLPEKIAPAGNRGVDVGIESDWYLSLPERSPGTVSPHRKIQAFPDTALRAKPHYPIRPPTYLPEKVVKKCLFYVVNIFIFKKI